MKIRYGGDELASTPPDATTYKFVIAGGRFAAAPSARDSDELMHEDLTQEIEQALGHQVDRSTLIAGWLWRHADCVTYDLAFERGQLDDVEAHIRKWAST